MPKVPGREINLTEVGSVLRDDNFATLRQMLCDPQEQFATQVPLVDEQLIRLLVVDKFGSGAVEFLQVTNDFIVIISDVALRQDVLIRYTGRNWLGFSYIVDGHITTTFDGFRTHATPGTSAHISMSPDGVMKTVKYSEGAGSRWISIMLNAAALHYNVGVDLDRLPMQFADIVAGQNAPYFNTDFNLDKSTLSVIGQMFMPPVPNLWRPMFLGAKAQELISLHLSGLARIQSGREKLLPLSSRDRRNIAEARELLEKDPFVTLTLPVLAKMVGINRSKLSSGFRQLYGITLRDYANALKMQRAERFLQTGEGSVSELASLLGYKHQANLATAIRKHFGSPPSKLMKR